MFETIHRTLFFSDVPDGTLKPRKVEREVRDLSDVVTNVGKDIHSAIFFDDLQSVCNQDRHRELIEEEMEKKRLKAAPVPQKPRQKRKPQKAPKLWTFKEIKEDMEAQKTEPRTIPSPSLARIEKINKRVVAEKRDKEMADLTKGLEEQQAQMWDLMKKFNKTTEQSNE